MSDDPKKLRLGGMALQNGLLVHGPTHWAAAIRTKDGEIKVASGRKLDLGGRAFARVPGMRGVYGGRLRNARQVEALTANLISVNRRYKAHAGIRITDI